VKAGSFSVELDRIIKEVKRRRAKLILLQAPDGLLPNIERLSDEIERVTGATVVLSLNPCYGACDVAQDTASTLGADVIVHLGHTPMRSHEDAIFIDCPHPVEVSERLISDIVAQIGDSKHVGLACSLQYVSAMERVARALSSAGFKAHIGTPSNPSMKSGQVTGCDVSAVKKLSERVDAFVVVSSGLFHALGVSLYTGKRTLLADVVNSRVVELKQEKKKRLALIVDMIERAKEASNFCVLVGAKSGQAKLEEALRIRKELIEAGKRARLACISELKPERLLYLKAEAFVQTVCPRISIDDIEAFDKPVLSLEQVPIMLEKLTYWDVYPT
jgi:2-(3-amino-3-carboxypropyl)histidine synthase